MMPVTGKDAVLDTPAMKRKTHMRAAVVECDHILAVGNDKYRPTWRAHHLGTQTAKLAQRSHTDERSVNDVHGTTPSQPRHNLVPGSRIRQITEATSGSYGGARHLIGWPASLLTQYCEVLTADYPEPWGGRDSRRRKRQASQTNSATTASPAKGAASASSESMSDPPSSAVA